jgi:hypothetical protein
MAQNILAGVLQGNNESAGFIPSYSKETLLCHEMLPVPDATYNRQQFIRYTQVGNAFYFTLRNTELQDR